MRRGDLLMVFVHTMWTGLGGEGHVETTWLREVLHRHADARHKLVLGHHPVFPINGFSGPYQREIGPEHAADFWNVLVEAGVLAYLCSHILAFDVQVHRGVLQVCTAGAGTAHRMPEGIEYLHCVQGALDAEGVRYQVLDTEGRVRERLSWPLPLADVTEWQTLPAGVGEAPLVGGPYDDRILGLRFTGRAAAAGDGSAQTLLSAFRPDLQMPLWIGLRGIDQRLSVIVGPEARRSPHYWYGPCRCGGFAIRRPPRHSHGHGPGRLPLPRRGRRELVVARCRLGLGRGAPRVAGALVYRPRLARSGRPALQGIDPRRIGAGLAMMREIGRDELEPLATGAWILGAGGGGNPYLSYLNLCRLYDDGARVSLLDPMDLADDDRVALVAGIGAPLVGLERLSDPRFAAKPLRTMEKHLGARFRAVMSGEIGGANGLRSLMVAGVTGLPVVDADSMGRAFPEGQMTSFAIAELPMLALVLSDIRDNEMIITRAADAKWMERLSRKACAEMGAVAAACKAPRTGREIKDHGILYSTTKAIRIGRARRRGAPAPRRSDRRPRRGRAGRAAVQGQGAGCRAAHDGRLSARPCPPRRARRRSRLDVRAAIPERVRRRLARRRGGGDDTRHHLHHGQRIGRGDRHRDAALRPAHQRHRAAGARAVPDAQGPGDRRPARLRLRFRLPAPVTPSAARGL